MVILLMQIGTARQDTYSLFTYKEILRMLMRTGLEHGGDSDDDQWRQPGRQRIRK